MIKTIRRAHHIEGSVALPGDKSISHRYALLAALAEGTTRIRHFSWSQDCRSTLRCLEALGVPIRDDESEVRIEGRGEHGLSKPEKMLDAGNSGSTIRMLSGILAGHAFESCISGDESLSRRPMGRIIEPLSLMGARIEAREGGLPPLRIRGGNLNSVRYTLPVASAQVKSCVLLAGLFADAPTAVHERIPTRNHTEIALCQFGARVAFDGEWIEVGPGPRLRSQQLEVPGDLSSAAFLIVAASLLPGSELVLSKVGLNPRRRKLLDYLEAAGLDIEIEKEYDSAGEPRGDLRVRHNEELLESSLPPIAGSLVAALIDEIPVLAVLGSQTAGGLEVSGAAELRIKESDRISAIAQNLRSMGASVEEKTDGLSVPGEQRLRGAHIRTRGDHRIAMAFSVAGLIAEGETSIEQAECADVSFPGFFETLARIART